MKGTESNDKLESETEFPSQNARPKQATAGGKAVSNNTKTRRRNNGRRTIARETQTVRSKIMEKAVQIETVVEKSNIDVEKLAEAMWNNANMKLNNVNVRDMGMNEEEIASGFNVVVIIGAR